ncbi:MAG: GTP 3',8-cyclase MoaA [Candidatus Rifleibacteriota bacterium]
MFKYLRLSITDRCNFRCIYCMPEEGICKQSHQNILRYEELADIVKAALNCGVEQVRITGGEPLIRAGVVDFIKSIAILPGLKDLCLTTNASRLATMAHSLKSAGLHRVNISLDSLDKENFRKITRNGDLEQVLAGIDAAIANDLMPVKINVVLIPGLNEHEIPDFVRFASENPVTVRFIERMPFEGAKNENSFISERQVLEIIQNICELETANEDNSYGPAHSFRIIGGKGKIGFISPRTRPFCQNCQRLRLTSTGFLLPCLDSDLGVKVRGKSVAEIEQIIKELYAKKHSWRKSKACFGTTFDSSLSKIGG